MGGLNDDISKPFGTCDGTSDLPEAEAYRRLEDLSVLWALRGITNPPILLQPAAPALPDGEDWICGSDAFDIMRLQYAPRDIAGCIARIFRIIVESHNWSDPGANYFLSTLPPTHPILLEFETGSLQWITAAERLLSVHNATEISGIKSFVDDLRYWVESGYFHLIRSNFLNDALEHRREIHEYSLPSVKQEPIWSFPLALTWIATRDYLALARMPSFEQAICEDDLITPLNHVWHHAERALGWLHSEIAFKHCRCGAFEEFSTNMIKHCTCISLAWEELVQFRGGLSPDTPELILSIQDGWLSMTWPDEADEIRFLRNDIIKRWPARPAQLATPASTTTSTAAAELECKKWLATEFEADPAGLKSKKQFRQAALAEFPGRLSERGFNQRVWPELARSYSRDGAGAKRKS